MLFGTKITKSLKKKEAKFNENTFKAFWEAEDGQVSLEMISSSRFHENVKTLEIDPEYEYENYNYVKR